MAREEARLSDETDDGSGDDVDARLAGMARDNAVYIALRALLAALHSREETAGVVGAAEVVAKKTAWDALASFGDQPYGGRVAELLREAVDDIFTFPDAAGDAPTNGSAEGG